MRESHWPFKALIVFILGSILFVQILILSELQSRRIPTAGEFINAHDDSERKELTMRIPVIDAR